MSPGRWPVFDVWVLHATHQILCRDNSDPPKSISNGAMVILRKGETETPRMCQVVTVPSFRSLN